MCGRFRIAEAGTSVESREKATDCPLASKDALQVSSLRITANIFQIWLTVAGFGKFAGGIRNQRRRSISNYLPDSLHLVAKYGQCINFFFSVKQSR